MTMRSAIAQAMLAVPLIAPPAGAGPCTQQIYDANIAVEQRLDAIAGTGKTGVQSPAATMHRQPTPSSIAGAEEKLGDISPATAEALHRDTEEARAADDGGDLAACRKALDDIRRLLSR
jgi:hypothetical protein